MKIHPVILSGGSGTRLWPMSRAALPKQLLPLVSQKSMLQDTVLRFVGWKETGSTLVVCGEDHRFLIAEQLREVGVQPALIALEPMGRNTAPAAAVAAIHLMSQAPDSLMLLLPADHVIQNIEAFLKAIECASVAAASGSLVTFGIRPDAPESGYGYIQQGKPMIDAPGCHKVARFVEKPDRPTAQHYLDAGDYFWNSGIFLFRPDVYLAELERLRPEIVRQTRLSYEGSQRDLDFCRLDKEAFTACPSDSIDYAVMEHTDRAAIVPVDMGWSDVGSWSALWSVLDKDDDGNVLRGDVYAEGVSGSMIRAESRLVVAFGLNDMILVETQDAVLVAHKDRAQDVKKAVDYLKKNGRYEHEFHTRVFRPWGWYESIDTGERFQVKRIMVKPGAKLSLQMHHHRAEHWVVVSGTALVTRGEETMMISENESTYIPLGVTHRLGNPGLVPLHIIEVQSGSYLGEDDIVRLEDAYQRN